MPKRKNSLQFLTLTLIAFVTISMLPYSSVNVYAAESNSYLLRQIVLADLSHSVKHSQASNPASPVAVRNNPSSSKSSDQSFPVPVISVSYTQTITLGQSATINLTATNEGGTAGYQTINTSFPTNISSSDVSIIATDIAYNYVNSPGLSWYACYGRCNVTLQYPMAEAVAYNWTNDVSHYMDVRVTPTAAGDYTFYYKSVASPYLSYLACCSDPSGGTQDQQNEYVYVATIVVKAPTGVPTFKLTVTPASRTISPGGETSYSVNIVPKSGFDSDVLLSLDPTQQGIECSFSSYSSTASSCNTSLEPPYASQQLYLTTTTSATTGQDVLILNGTSSDNSTLASFTLDISPPSPAMTDTFASDSNLNSSMWRINSPVLSNISQVEGGYFNGESINLVAPTMSFSSTGLNWIVSGNPGLSGLTTQAAFTPPFTVGMNVTPDGARSGGNPVAVYISNAEATTLFALYLSGTEVCTADQSAAPTCSSQINQAQAYTISLSVGLSNINATVNGVGTSFSQTFPLSQSGDYAYYVTIGSFAGQIPNVEGGSTTGYADEAIFTSFQITSSFLRSLSVNVNTEIKHGPSGPSNHASLNLTNLLTGQSYLGSTNKAGDYTFSDLVTGTYSLTANQSCGAPGCTQVLFNSTSLVIGEPSDPSVSSLTTELTIITPQIPTLSLNVLPLSPISGVYPILSAINLSAIPFGGVGNYVVNWSENGQTLEKSGEPITSESIEINFTGPGTYAIQAHVSSSGSWFGETKLPTKYAKSIPIDIVVKKSNFYAVFNTLTTNAISLQYNSAYQAALDFSGSNVYINTTVSNNIAGIELPQLLINILGLSYPWYEIQLNDSASNQVVSTGTLEQLESSAYISSVMPSGTPTTTSALVCTSGSSCYEFSVVLNSVSGRALLADFVSIVLSVIGIALGNLLPETVVGFLVQTLVSMIWDQAQTFATDMITQGAASLYDQIVTFFSDYFWSYIGSLQYILPPLLTQLGVAESVVTSIGKEISGFLDGLNYVKGIAQIGFDLGSLLGVLIGQYLGNNVQTFDFFSVTEGNSPLRQEINNSLSSTQIAIPACMSYLVNSRRSFGRL